jgi:hypothetical protein
MVTPEGNITRMILVVQSHVREINATSARLSLGNGPKR